MAEKKKSRSEKMYGDSPTLKRDEEDGKMKARKPSEDKKKADEVQGGTGGAEREGGEKDGAVPHEVRHAMERHEMHGRHEREHMMHDHGEHGDKKEMHSRHEKEKRSMHTRHEGEMASGEKMIEKVEESKKEGEGE